MKVQFSDISSTGERFTLSDLPVPAGCTDFKVQGLVTFTCSLQKKTENKVVLQGTLVASLLLCCDRCLCDFSYQIDSDMRLIFEVQSQEHWQLKDLDVVAADLDVIELVEPVIDLEEIAWQQLYIALPAKQVCARKCKGLCPQCGSNLNEKKCSCEGAGKPNPFAVLAVLKKK